MATRPVYNTGKGFFTLDNKIYDARGVEFKIRGVNTAHYDEEWVWNSDNHGLPNTKANANRIIMPLYSEIPAGDISNVMDVCINSCIVPIPEVVFWKPGWNLEERTCGSDDLDLLETVVGQWVTRASLFKPYERYMFLDIAGEWGGDTAQNKLDWRDAYIEHVVTLRNAGYLCPLIISTCGYSGQDFNSAISYGQAIIDADPQKNIIFDAHMYGYWYVGTPDWEEFELYSSLNAIVASGFPWIIGEFGPGNDDLPVGFDYATFNSSTTIPAIDAAGLGWTSWAWDDGVISNSHFAMTTAKNFILNQDGSIANGSYPNNTDLSLFGNKVVLHPDFGTFYHPSPTATIFGEGLIF